MTAFHRDFPLVESRCEFGSSSLQSCAPQTERQCLDTGSESRRVKLAWSRRKAGKEDLKQCFRRIIHLVVMKLG